MKLINSKKKCLLFKDGSFYVTPQNLEVWAEIMTLMPVTVYDISPMKPLSDALEDEFLSVRTDPWIASKQDFLKVDCTWCSTTTVYGTKSDLPRARGEHGFLVCPCCQAPWLFYRYKRKL